MIARAALTAMGLAALLICPQLARADAVVLKPALTADAAAPPGEAPATNEPESWFVLPEAVLPEPRPAYALSLPPAPAWAREAVVFVATTAAPADGDRVLVRLPKGIALCQYRLADGMMVAVDPGGELHRLGPGQILGRIVGVYYRT